jgi:D-beta-D-heptose 7-phosphate kinase/D-beta-D-heptose 1-phosphate adenosyltransferase
MKIATVLPFWEPAMLPPDLGCTVVTNGCFDLLGPHHVSLLNWCGEQYPYHTLIVLLNRDESVEVLKGKTRPVVPFEERALMLSSLSAVDLVIGFSEPSPQRVLQELKPDVYVKGGEDSNREPDWLPVVKSPHFQYPSTTKRIQMIQKAFG